MKKKRSGEVCSRCGADGFFERRVAHCGGCGRKQQLCPSCAPTWVACTEKCRAEWREEMARVMSEPLVAPGGGRRKKPKEGQQMLPGFA